MKRTELKQLIKEELLKLNSILNEASDPKPSLDAKKKLKGMIKIPAKQFHQTNNFIYYSKINKTWWFIDFEGDLMQINNKGYLNDIDKYIKNNQIKLN